MSARVAPWKKPPGRPLNVQELTFTQPRRIFPQLHLGPDILVYWPDMSPDTWPLCRLTSSIRYQINGSILWPHSSSSTYYVVEPVKISDPSESNAVCWPSIMPTGTMIFRPMPPHTTGPIVSVGLLGCPPSVQSPTIPSTNPHLFPTRSHSPNK